MHSFWRRALERRSPAEPMLPKGPRGQPAGTADAPAANPMDFRHPTSPSCGHHVQVASVVAWQAVAARLQYPRPCCLRPLLNLRALLRDRRETFNPHTLIRALSHQLTLTTHSPCHTAPAAYFLASILHKNAPLAAAAGNHRACQHEISRLLAAASAAPTTYTHAEYASQAALAQLLLHRYRPSYWSRLYEALPTLPPAALAGTTLIHTRAMLVKRAGAPDPPVALWTRLFDYWVQGAEGLNGRMLASVLVAAAGVSARPPARAMGVMAESVARLSRRGQLTSKQVPLILRAASKLRWRGGGREIINELLPSVRKLHRYMDGPDVARTLSALWRIADQDYKQANGIPIGASPEPIVGRGTPRVAPPPEARAVTSSTYSAPTSPDTRSTNTAVSRPLPAGLEPGPVERSLVHSGLSQDFTAAGGVRASPAGAAVESSAVPSPPPHSPLERQPWQNGTREHSRSPRLSGSPASPADPSSSPAAASAAPWPQEAECYDVDPRLPHDRYSLWDVTEPHPPLDRRELDPPAAPGSAAPVPAAAGPLLHELPAGQDIDAQLVAVLARRAVAHVADMNDGELAGSVVSLNRLQSSLGGVPGPASLRPLALAAAHAAPAMVIGDLVECAYALFRLGMDYGSIGHRAAVTLARALAVKVPHMGFDRIVTVLYSAKVWSNKRPLVDADAEGDLIEDSAVVPDPSREAAAGARGREEAGMGGEGLEGGMLSGPEEWDGAIVWAPLHDALVRLLPRLAPTQCARALHALSVQSSIAVCAEGEQMCWRVLLEALSDEVVERMAPKWVAITLNALPKAPVELDACLLHTLLSVTHAQMPTFSPQGAAMALSCFSILRARSYDIPLTSLQRIMDSLLTRPEWQRQRPAPQLVALVLNAWKRSKYMLSIHNRAGLYSMVGFSLSRLQGRMLLDVLVTLSEHPGDVPELLGRDMWRTLVREWPSMDALWVCLSLRAMNRMRMGCAAGPGVGEAAHAAVQRVWPGIPPEARDGVKDVLAQLGFHVESQSLDESVFAVGPPASTAGAWATEEADGGGASRPAVASVARP